MTRINLSLPINLQSATRERSKFEFLRHGDALIIGTQLASQVAMAALVTGAAHLSDALGGPSIQPLLLGGRAVPIVLSALTAGAVGFYGGPAAFVDKSVKSWGLLPVALRPDPKHDATGAWIGDHRFAQFYDDKLAAGICAYLDESGLETVVDIGCGPGDYVKKLNEEGFDCDGFDGNPDTERLSGGTCQVQNFAKPVDLGKKYDCVLSLEVGGKVPRKYEDNFIQNLADHAKNTIIVSWPVEGQKGFQLNRRNNDFVIDRFKEKGWEYDPEATQQLRDSVDGSVYYWYEKSLMVFKKID